MIKSELNNYLGFDSSDLFIDPLVRVFGGAVRDIICGDPINDVDILCGSWSFPILKEILLSKGYHFHSGLSMRDIESLYSGISVICEPHTFISGDGKSVVQLIRPARFVHNDLSNYMKKDIYHKSYINLLRNVDISCCGVSWDGSNLYQNCQDSVLHCLKKVFVVNKNALMLTNRLQHRLIKLEDRGWVKFDSNDPNNRDLRISGILDVGCEIEIDFINEI